MLQAIKQTIVSVNNEKFLQNCETIKPILTFRYTVLTVLQAPQYT